MPYPQKPPSGVSNHAHSMCPRRIGFLQPAACGALRKSLHGLRRSLPRRPLPLPPTSLLTCPPPARNAARRGTAAAGRSPPAAGCSTFCTPPAPPAKRVRRDRGWKYDIALRLMGQVDELLRRTRPEGEASALKRPPLELPSTPTELERQCTAYKLRTAAMENDLNRCANAAARDAYKGRFHL